MSKNRQKIEKTYYYYIEYYDPFTKHWLEYEGTRLYTTRKAARESKKKIPTQVPYAGDDKLFRQCDIKLRIIKQTTLSEVIT